MYSVLILTKDEGLTLEDCLASVVSDGFWVLDSCSTDGTREIALEHKAKFVQREFDNYSNQRNFGLSLEFKYEWILMLDADERLSGALQKKINGILANTDVKTSIISVLRKDYLFGTWLRGASGYPVYFPRIFRRNTVTVERAINEHYRALGDTMLIDEHIDHLPFAKGLHYWFERHNSYSSMEAVNLLEDQPIHNLNKYFAARYKLKRLFYRLPFRPVLMFIYLYIFKRGFLAGQAGLYFCLLRSFYEFQIQIKQKERQLVK